MHYLTETKMFNTGFIPSDSTRARLLQGLTPQNISNLSLYNPDFAGRGYSACKTNSCMFTACDTQLLYPINSTPLKYGIPSIPDSCPCTAYIKAP